MTNPILKFIKHTIYTPNPVPAKPLITDAHRALAAEDPPHAVPFHCKPWLDGQKLGYTLFYGYLSPITVVGVSKDEVYVEGHERVKGERKGKALVDTFAEGHFGISIAYTLVTPPGMVTAVLPANNPPPGFHLLTGVIETDWYPKEIFLVGKIPAKGEKITFNYKDELARAVVIPRPQPLPAAQELTGEETAVLDALKARYQAEEAQTHTRWKDARGQVFTHLYRVWSHQHRSELVAGEQEEDEGEIES